MTYILADQRDNDVAGAFKRYRAYLQTVRARFPSTAFALSTSDWYFNFGDHRCPHDAHLEWLKIEESRIDKESNLRAVSIAVRLLGAYDDGAIELRYPTVYAYQLRFLGDECGLWDWRYDEFRLSEGGHLVHEIEWCRLSETGRWVIEASDVEFRWIDFKSN